MKLLTAFLILISISYFSCSRGNTTRVRTFNFPLDTMNSEKFGFARYYFGLIEFVYGPNNLWMNDSTIFVTDDFHRNVKRIDIRTGDLSASAVLGSGNGHKLFDLQQWGDEVIVTLNSDTVHILSEDLKRDSLLKISNPYKDPVFINSVDTGGISFYVQFTDSLFEYNRDWNLVGKSKCSRMAMSSVIFKNDTILSPHGKLKYNAQRGRETICLEDSRCFCLAAPIKQYMDAVNIDCTSDKFVVYDIDQNQVIVRVYSLGEN